MSFLQHYNWKASVFVLNLLYVAQPSDLGWGRAHLLGSYPFVFLTLPMGFSRQEYWSGLPFSSPVDYVLSEHFTMTRLSWVAVHSVAPSFIEFFITFAITKLWFMHPLLVRSVCMPFWSTEYDTTFGTIRRSIMWLLLSSVITIFQEEHSKLPSWTINTAQGPNY